MDKIIQGKIRNIAIIAHVDHGKTTLVDAFLKASHLFRENQAEFEQNQILDTGELEREKGITINAKNIAIHYKDYKINIIDTPGHADFGGEVERTLNMADGCLLLVDAQEGPMPQTRFVLKKALEYKLKPLVVINKIDKKHADVKKVLNKLNDLFLSLATDLDQLEFPVFYAIAREGKVFTKLPEGDLTIPNSTNGDMTPLFEAIVNEVPAPIGDEDAPLQMLISSQMYDEHIGRYLIGKISRGTVHLNDPIVVINPLQENKIEEKGRISKILVRDGLSFQEVKEAGAGEIVSVAGVNSIAIGSTLCAASTPEPLPTIKISEPSVQIKFEANTSPLVGKDGEFVTAKLLQQRLEKELESNISLRITKGEGGSYYVAGRGEFQLSILIETIRREGYEFQIRKPEVILKEENGQKFEPLEEVVIEVPEDAIGNVTRALGERNAELVELENEDNGLARFTYKILTRNLLGLRSELMTSTKGNLVISNYLLDYVPFTPQKELFRKGVLIASHPGIAAGYSLNTIQERGELFISPSEEVYEGMIVGINKFEQDMEVNVTKERQKSAVRMKHDEITQTALKPPIELTLEFALGFLANDEVLEVTPKHLRLRKHLLTKTERIWAKRKKLSAFAAKNLKE